MLESGIHPATGLRALSGQTAPRVVALASHGDRSSELPVLCGLCDAWSDFGYLVAVLDATVTESDKHPGLLQLLQPSFDSTVADSGQAAWPILPSALGLAHLGRATAQHGSSQSMLARLGSLFENYEIVLIYASAQDLASCLPDSGVEPMLAVSAKGMSVLSAYQSLKQLLIVGRLQPTIVAVMDESDQTSLLASRSMGKSLQDCALSFLSRRVDSLAVLTRQDSAQPSDDMHRLALRVLESAPSLRQHTSQAATARRAQFEPSNGFARSH
jgi:HPt (histidine-containing phosphotransfer) domain-containing protein